LEESELVYRSSLLGRAVGSLKYDVASDPIEGRIVLIATATDASDTQVMTTSDSLVWQSASTWASSGNIVFQSLLSVRSSVNWNASLDFDYGFNEYSFSASERKYNTSYVADDDTSSVDVFLVNGQGVYGSQTGGHYW
jgi:hypothetical protein